MSVTAKVGFDHTGDDGEKRVPGDIVTVSDEEFRRRGPDGDGFMREASKADARDAVADASDKTKGAVPPAGSKK